MNVSNKTSRYAYEVLVEVHLGGIEISAQIWISEKPFDDILLLLLQNLCGTVGESLC